MKRVAGCIVGLVFVGLVLGAQWVLAWRMDHGKPGAFAVIGLAIVGLVLWVITIQRWRGKRNGLYFRAARVMNEYGNITNWPPEMPAEYAEVINELRSGVDNGG